jgi:NADP-dependent aldehyde dehydrogenase
MTCASTFPASVDCRIASPWFERGESHQLAFHFCVADFISTHLLIAMSLHGKNFIGAELSSGSGETFRASNPAESQELPENFFVASERDIGAAVERSAEAFQLYRRTTGEQRATFLERIATEIEALGDALLQRASQETGLTIPRLTGERARTTGQLRMFAQVVREGSWVDARIDPAQPERQPLPRVDLRGMLIPIGPVAVFGSSNFPFAYSVAGGDTAAALATGNTVVVKAHERHPGTSEMVANAIQRAAAACQLPAGVFSMLHGTGKAVGIPLVKHPLLQAVGFTGSHAAGRALMDAAAARPSPIPVFAEMSSLNPVFILPEALRTLAAKIAEGLRNSLTLGGGQFCTKPGLVFGVQSPEFENFQRTLATQLEGVAPITLLHAGIRDSFERGTARAEKLSGVKILAKSKATAEAQKTQAGAYTVHTDTENFLRNHELSEEVFGPFGVLVSATSIQDLEKVAKQLSGHLTASVHGTPNDLAQAKTLIGLLEQKAGRLIINGFPTGVEVCPAMNHGGPYPATSDVRFTAVGARSLYRFVRPICYQDCPQDQLPLELRDDNPLKIRRTVNGVLVA